MKYCYTLCLLLISSVLVAQVEARIILQVNDELPQGVITNVNRPFTNEKGDAGFTGQISQDGQVEDFVYYKDDILFMASEALPTVLTNAEIFMGISNDKEFVYSPSSNNNMDALYTDEGYLAQAHTQAPGFDEGVNSTFHSVPRMTPDGTCFWLAGYDDGSGNQVTVGRVLYTKPPNEGITVLLKSGETIDGVTLTDGSGIRFDYDISSNNAHYINIAAIEFTDPDAATAVIVDGSTVVQIQNDPTGGGDNYNFFRKAVINNAGDYIISGTTDQNNFLAANGTIIFRNSDLIDDLSVGQVIGLSLNENNQLAHMWSRFGNNQAIFIGDVDNLATTSQLLVQTGDEIDTDGDGIGDFILNNIYNNRLSITLTESGSVLIKGSYTPVAGGSQRTGVLEILAAPVVLPIDLQSLTARVTEQQTVNLNWTTATETENRGFEIQRTTPDATQTWQTIGFVAGSGNIQRESTYAFEDKEPYLGENLYRLRQLDFDGQAEYSPIVSANIQSSPASIRLYPTLVDDRLHYEGLGTVSSVTISDINGRLVDNYIHEAGFVLFGSDFPVGSYLVTLQGSFGTLTRKFIKR